MLGKGTGAGEEDVAAVTVGSANLKEPNWTAGETYNVLLVKAIVSGQEILANYVQGSRKPYAAEIQRVFNWTCTCCACCHSSPQCSH